MKIINQILSFIAVVEEQSFTKASERLFVTPTAISKQIKLLESRLHTQLFERTTRHVRITDMGERFYAHCKKIADEISAAENFIELQQEEPQGKLRVLSSLVFAESYLTKYIFEFHKRFPKIQLDLEYGDYIPNLEKENFDVVVGFRMMPQVAPQLRFKQLMVTTFVLCAAPHYLKKYGTPKTPKDLRTHQFINHPIRQPLNVIKFRDGTEVTTKMPEIIISNVSALISICIDGAGIFLVSIPQVKEYLNSGKLVQLLPDYAFEEFPVYLFYRPSEYEQKKVRCFIDFLVEKCKGSVL